jgi:acyl-CoA synthetase (AMP-forming)/AMP-acid ligase II
VSTAFLRERLRAAGDAPALVWRDRVFSHRWLDDEISRRGAELAAAGVRDGSVVSLEADFSPAAVAAWLALVERACILVPLTSSVEVHKAEFREIAEVERTVVLDADDRAEVRATGAAARHPLLLRLRERGHPGLVLFSSGSTGRSKAALHDFVPLLRKFEHRRPALRTLTFLLFDHIGGVNTLFHTLANQGCVVTVSDRSPDAVCAAIARHRVELLPTSPTFLNLLLLSGAHRRHDLGSLSLVTYGTEPMPEATLARVVAELPGVRLQQTYGLSEVGILRSKSRGSDSLWVKLGGEGFETRVRDGLLEIRAESAMQGYLNAASPFTEEGWFATGDAVLEDGEWLRILGRRSELINVGGEKVYPAEVEGVLQQIEGVEDVAVSGEPHPITGQIVKARVKLSGDESLSAFRRRMHDFCRGRLARHKIPQKVVLTTESFHGGRFKKLRREP